MTACIKKRTVDKFVEIELSATMPASKAKLLEDALIAVMALAGHKVRRLNAEGEELFSREEVFPDSHPGSRLRGLRAREGITQKQMAEKLDLRPQHISEMEKGARPISVELAKRIGKTFAISYKAFL